MIAPPGRPARRLRNRALPYVGIALAAAALLWDRGLPCAPVDFLHEGQHLAWANCALRGLKPQLDVRTLYGFLQTEALAATLKTFGLRVLIWRRYAFALKVAGVALFVAALWSLATGWAVAAWAVPAVLLASTSLFTWLHYDPMRSALPLFALALACRGTRAAGIAGFVCGISFFWSPEFALAGAAASVFTLARGGRGRLPRWAVGAALALLLPLPWARARWPELLWNHVEFILDRAGGYARIPLPAWGIAYLAVPGAALALAASGWISRQRDPALAALGLFALACAVPALTRPDRLHLDLAFIPLLAATARWAATIRAPARPWIGAGALALAIAHGALSGDRAAWHLATRWLPSEPAADAARARPQPSPEFRLAGLRLDSREAELLQRITRLLGCAALPGEPVFLLANEQVFYFLADRLPATRFPLFFVRHTPRQRGELAAELERVAPRFVLVSRNAGIDRPAAETHPELVRFVQRGYEPLRRVVSSYPPGLNLPDVDYTLLERRDSFATGTGGSRLRPCVSPP